MKKIVIFIVIIAVIASASLWAGGGKEKSDNFAGVYYGVIPSASGSGIAVVVILNEGGNYKITYQYIDRDNGFFTYTGKYLFDNKTGIVTLDSVDLPRYYKIGNKSLTQLDAESKKITGKLARNYILKKI